MLNGSRKITRKFFNSPGFRVAFDQCLATRRKENCPPWEKHQSSILLLSLIKKRSPGDEVNRHREVLLLVQILCLDEPSGRGANAFNNNRGCYKEMQKNLQCRGGNGSVGRGEIFAVEFALGTVFDYPSQAYHHKTIMVSDPNRGYTVFAKQPIHKGEVVAVYDLLCLSSGHCLYPVNNNGESMASVKSQVDDDYAIDVAAGLTFYGNYQSSFFGKGQFINDLVISNKYFKCSPGHRKFIPKDTMSDWKRALDRLLGLFHKGKASTEDEAYRNLVRLSCYFDSFQKEYTRRCLDYSNVIFKDYCSDDNHRAIQVVATKNCEPGDELSVAYGALFWTEWGCDMSALGLRESVCQGDSLGYMMRKSEEAVSCVLQK